MPETSRNEPQPIERVVAALVFAVPLYYLVTERTNSVFVVTWSKPWTVLVLVSTALYTSLLWSYARQLPHWVRISRSLAVAITGSAMLAVVGVELSLRVRDDPPFEVLPDRGRHAADPDVGHVFVPRHSQRLQGREFSIPWSSNAQGVRAERDYGPKPAGVLRVLACGDSFTEGAQVPYAQTWPAQLETCMNDALGDGRVEVVNAGFPAYGTVNEARWIAKFGAAFEPDLVLLAMTPDDLRENQTPLQFGARDGQLVESTSTDADYARAQHRARWWCLAGAVERSLLWQRVAGSRSFRRLTGRSTVDDVEAYLTEPNDNSRRLYELAEQCLLEARDAAGRLGAKFGVVVIPRGDQLHELGPGLDPRLFGEHWADFGRAHGFPVVDCLPVFVSHPDPGALHWREDARCTAAGHELVGRAACRLLLQNAATLGLPSPAK